MLTNTIGRVVFVLFSLIVRVRSQICQGFAQNDECSSNIACGCFQMANSVETGICGFRYVSCSELVACESVTNRCYEPNHICVHYSRCFSRPVCLSASMIDERICPSMKTTNTTTTSSTTTITSSTTTQQLVTTHPIKINQKWKQHGITVAGGNGYGNQLNQLSGPYGIYVDDDDQCIYIADSSNHRIVEWKFGANNGKVVAGGNEYGNRTDQLIYPIDVIVDRKNDSLIICDYGNSRVVEWSRQNGTKEGQTIISNIYCYGITMDNNGDLYVLDVVKNEVRRWKRGETEGIIVAGGNGEGDQLDQLNFPAYLFVDDDQSVYVTDNNNQRVMKWMKGAKEGVIVAGGQGYGSSLSQLYYPNGVIVDQWDNVYVADRNNDRIMCWSKGSKEGRVIVGENGKGKQPNQLNGPTGISFDQQGHLYVVDMYNSRVQKFEVDNE